MTATTQFDRCLIDLCRQLDYKREDVDPGPDDESNSFGGEGVLSLLSLPLSDYTKEELQYLSSSLGNARVGRLEIEGVDDLDWDAILNSKNSALYDLQVTVRSSRALVHLMKSLCRNQNLSSLELDYYHLDEDTQDHFGDSESDNDESEDKNDVPFNNVLSTNTSASPLANHDLFFEALMPLHHVVLRGITPSRQSPSTAFDSGDRTIPCSWEHLTIEDCDLTGGNMIWVASCITNLQEIVIHNCQLSEPTIRILAEAYLTASTCTGRSRKPNGRYETRKERPKNALQVLDLSNNEWILPSCGDGRALDNVLYSKDSNFLCDRSMALPSPSCVLFLASWLDSLSNLVELNLSHNPQLFCRGIFEDTNRGMVDLCGTVNQSLKRMSLRHCNLIPNDLHHLVNTFCWLEALDLSENPDLTDNLLPLSQLEHLTELVLENMVISDSNDTFEFERLLCDEDFDLEAMGQGLTDLLFELLNGESPSFLDFDGSSRSTEFCRRRRRPLERLNLSGNVLSRNTLRVLSMFEALKVLILMGCQINDDGVVELLSDTKTGSRNHSSLTELYLASNTIGDIGVLALARSLREEHLSRLKVLDIGSSAISVDAFRVFVENGVVHSKRLESVEVSNAGAITQIQQQTWNALENLMEHNLLLNQAGRFTLYMDCNSIGFERQDDTLCNPQRNFDYGNDRNQSVTCRMGISNYLWPYILEDADSIYGPDAVFHFLHKRPDLILAPNQSSCGSSFKNNYQDDSITPLKPTTQTRNSPKCVTDIAAQF